MQYASMNRATSLASVGVVALACAVSATCSSGNAGQPSSGGGASSGPALSSLALFPTRRVLVVGEALMPQVTARDTAGAEVQNVVPQYSSSNANVARVERDRIVAGAVGTATVTASAGGKTAEIVIHVGTDAFNANAPESLKVLDANYIDLSKIERISRYRSTVGHTWGLEPCRSMKHYFQPRLGIDWTTVDVFAPASGTIFVIARDGSAGYRLMLRPRDLPGLSVTLFHVNPDPGIVVESWVDAGQHIGRHAASTTMSDIATYSGPYETGTFVSYFEAMTDAVFNQYRARGVPSREAAIITRAERDADPVPCEGEGQFFVHGKLPDWLVLN